MKWLSSLERKFGKIAIPNLMLLIVIGQFSVFAANILIPQLHLSSWISLNRSLILQGQIWRVVTFLFYPPSSSPLWIVFSLYFYYMIGNALEQQWGSFRFNVYYFVGAISAIASAMLTGYATNVYLNFSLFFAFAMMFPNFQVMLFFILPIKIKYLAWVDAIFFLFSFLVGSWSVKVSVLLSLVNFFIFFGGDFLRTLKNKNRYRKNQQQFRDYMNRR